MNEFTEPKYSEGNQRTDGFPYFALYPKSSYNPSYEEYREINPSDDNVIIRNQTDLQDFVDQIQINVFPRDKRPNAAGSMTSDGRLYLYNEYWIDKNKKPSVEEIKDYIKEKTQDVIVHEIAHYINAIRSSHRTGKAIEQRAKTRGKDPYAESTEEIQSRIIEFSKYLENLIKTPVDKINDTDGKDLLYALAVKDFDHFYPAAFRTKSFSAMYKLYKENALSPNTFQRVINRLYQIYVKYTKEDLPIYKAIRRF